MQNQLSQIMTLNPQELIKWCRMRKKTLNLSNQSLSELSGVPIGTIDRIMSGNYCEFKYSSIQPIIGVLIEINKETPPPDYGDDSQSDYYYETIRGYKLVVENKNNIIDRANREYESMLEQMAFLKEENKHKQRTIEELSEHISWMEKLIDRLREKADN